MMLGPLTLTVMVMAIGTRGKKVARTGSSPQLTHDRAHDMRLMRRISRRHGGLRKDQSHIRSIGESSVHQPADETAHDSHKSSGKRIASQIVTPARYDNDDNVTKCPRVSPRLLTFSPIEKVLPADAQIIGALNGMEIIDTTNTDVKLHDTMMVAETQDDDLLGEDLMDMEAGTNAETEGNV
ncbi:hypothetical protein YC2023_084119 [Brassica napus]